MQIIARVLLSFFFVAAGVGHFVYPDLYLRMIPPQLPEPRALVATSGVFEVVFGMGVMFARTRKMAGYGLIALLIAIFPANIYMALHNELFPAIDPLITWWRLPLQGVFIAWVWYACLKGK